jgi:hypothetical protein
MSVQRTTVRRPISTALPSATRKDWWLRIPLVALEVFVGGGGVYGGVEMLRDPLTPMGTTTDLIEGSPFETYTWPGVLLLALVGVAPLVLAGGLLLKVRGSVELSAGFGLGLMAWICVQWALLTDHLWLQPVMFGLGAVIVALASVLYRRRP